MKTESQRPKDRKDAISALNVSIEALSLAEKTASIASTKAVFGSVSTLLATTRVRFLLFCDDLLQIHTYLGLDG